MLCCVTLQVDAQDSRKIESLSSKAQYELEEVINAPVQHKYKFWDNLFFGASIGINYSMSEYVRQERFFKMLRPQVDFWLGKHFSKAIALRAGLWFMSQEASIPKELQTMMEDRGNFEPYNFCMMGAKTDLMYSLNRIFKSYNYNERFRLWLVAGIDGFRSFAFQKKVQEWENVFPIEHNSKWCVGGHAGFEAQLRQGDHYSLIFSGLWHHTSGSYNGQPLSDGGGRSYLTFNFGFVYRFTNSKGEIGFHNCRHNENYYFDEMNRRLNCYFEKRGFHNPGSNDSVITIPTHYSYLTPLQHKKLDKLIQRLEANPDEVASIDVYSDGDETPVYNQFRAENREERILNYIAKKSPKVLDRVVITKHQEASPIPPFSIWSRAGIIRYKKKNEQQ